MTGSAVSPLGAAEWTFPPRDWTSVDTSSDVDLVATLGYIPRVIRADAAGTVVFRCVDTPAGDPDTTMNLAAGEPVVGFFTEIKAASTATIHVAK